jgi:alkylation response protein AidB-like acyl-CoA dehydrogenase
VDFTLTDDQQLLVDSVSSLLERACPPSVVRAVADGERDAARPVAHALADYAALGDGPACDHVLVAERAGAACAPGPWFVTSALALPLLRAAQHALADDVAAGRRAATVGWAGSDGTWTIPPPSESRRTFVLDLDLVDDAVVAWLDGISVSPASVSGAREIGWRDLTRTAWELDTSTDLSAPVSVLQDEQFEGVLRRATVVLAAELCGTARRMLEMTVAYARERVQFERPIGSFQAVQHLLADLALDVERAWAATQWAAMCLDADADSLGQADAPRAVHVAKAAASEAALHACRTSIQVHGGIGYTWEHDLHLWLRRAVTSVHLLGTADEHHDALAALVVRA